MKFTRTGLICLVVVAGLATGCGGGDVTKEDFIAKVKTEKEFQGLPQKAYDCMADLMMNSANKEDLKQYVDGKKTMDQIKQTKSDAEMQKDAEKCVSQ
ncbi:hypothetical protein GCM10010191_74480 [Actinomadura vinacea]|uniref:Lipoprotein n=1 Tax=Actinomadura vinacea TaxID=115336 RepID=A0ABN3K4E6_9ACTN